MQDEDSHCNPLHDDDSRCHPLQNDDDPRCSSPVVDDASDQHLSPPSSSGNLCFYCCFSALHFFNKIHQCVIQSNFSISKPVYLKIY